MTSDSNSTRPARETTIDIPGLTLAARRRGNPAGTPVLAGHGWLDNAATFGALAPLLDELEIVAIDFPGHGRSDHRSADGAYHFIDLVSVYLHAADALGWDRFSLLGHSMGAAAALLTAGTCPERIERLVLLDGIGPWATPPEEAPAQLAEAIAKHRRLARRPPPRFDALEDIVSVVAETRALSKRRARPLAERGARRVDDHWEFTYDPRLRGPSHLRLTEPQVLAFLHRIDAPTLLVRPDNGWPVAPDLLERRIEAIDPDRLERLPGNHHVHLEHPERVAPHVRALFGLEPAPA